MARIDAFLKLGLAQGCSDVHLSVGVPPMLRMNGDLLPIKFRQLSDTELESYVREILTPNQIETLEAGHDLDFSYVAEEGGRFRVNVFRKVTGYGAVFRHIPPDVPTLEQLNMPKVLTDFCDYHQGMVLVTGSTGTGKSTTLAAMINHINENSYTRAKRARLSSVNWAHTSLRLPPACVPQCVKTPTSSLLVSFAMPKRFRWR